MRQAYSDTFTHMTADTPQALPPELQHEGVRSVTDLSAAAQHRYTITFDGEDMPPGYMRRLRDSDWRLVSAEVTRVSRGGLLGRLLPDKPALLIHVQRDRLDLGGGGQ